MDPSWEAASSDFRESTPFLLPLRIEVFSNLGETIANPDPFLRALRISISPEVINQLNVP